MKKLWKAVFYSKSFEIWGDGKFVKVAMTQSNYQRFGIKN